MTSTLPRTIFGILVSLLLVPVASAGDGKCSDPFWCNEKDPLSLIFALASYPTWFANQALDHSFEIGSLLGVHCAIDREPVALDPELSLDTGGHCTIVPSETVARAVSLVP